MRDQHPRQSRPHLPAAGELSQRTVKTCHRKAQTGKSLLRFKVQPVCPQMFDHRLKSAVFAVFMMAITFNGFNARTSHINPFEGLGRNKTFIWVMLSVFALQFVFITFGGEVLSVESLSVTGWLTCIALAFLIIPIDMIRKAIMRKTK